MQTNNKWQYTDTYVNNGKINKTTNKYLLTNPRLLKGISES